MIEINQNRLSLLEAPGRAERARATRMERSLPVTETPSSEGGGAIANQPPRVEFSDVLAKAVEGVRAAYGDADEAATDAMLGRGTPHQAMLAMSKADLAFRFVTQTRNKVVEAYREMMSLQV